MMIEACALLYSKFTIMIINSPKSSMSEKIDADRSDAAPWEGPVVENVERRE